MQMLLPETRYFCRVQKKLGGKEEIRKGFFRSDAGTGGPIFGRSVNPISSGHTGALPHMPT